MNLSVKKFLTILIIVLLIGALSLTMLACNPEDPDPPIDDDPVPDEIQYILTNGNFKLTTGTTYPLSPNNWTGSRGSTAGSAATPGGTDNLLAGVISVNEKTYNANKDKWGNLDNPGKIGADDNNILMIYNKVDTAYRFTNSFTAAIGKYYKISIPIKTIIENGAGAFIYITGGAYAAFERIDTNNTWDTYEVYVEASLISSASISVNVALGYGDLNSGNMTKGYAFFDEIMVEEVTSTDYASSVRNAKTEKYSMRTPDSRMENTTSASIPQLPAGYSTKTGTGAGGNAPTSSTYLTRGIVNTANWNSSHGENPGSPIEGFGDKILMIWNKQATAAGYAGNRKMRFEIGKYYELSVDVWVELDPEQENLEHKGASLILTGADEYRIDNIDTGGEWVRYYFYIESNEVRNKDFALEMWLGQGGKEDTDTLTKGKAFFDNVLLEEITQATYNDQMGDHSEDDVYYFASLLSINPNLIPNYNLEDLSPSGLPEGWEETEKEIIVNPDEIRYIQISADDILNEWTNDIKDKYFGLETNPLSPYPVMAPVFMIYHSIPTVSGMIMADSVDIMPNLHYRIAIWIKTVDIPQGGGLDIMLVTGEGDDKKTLSSFTAVNTFEYTDSYTNDYREVVFYVQGHELDQKDIRIEFSLGSGNAYNPAKYVMGRALIANVNMEQVSYTEYNTTGASTYIKKHSMRGAASVITNGNFNRLDLSKTTVDEFGQLIDIPGTPEGWTPSSTTETNVYSGIVNADNQSLLDNLGLGEIYNIDGWDLPFPVDFGAPNALLIQAKPSLDDYDGSIKPFGYTSNSFTLQSNSYYKVKAYVKTLDATASILLTPTTNLHVNNHYDIDTNGEWQEYVFVIETGRASIVTKLELYLGNKGSEDKFSGAVIFDSVSFALIDKDEYTALSNNDNVMASTYKLETFDNMDTSAVGVPKPHNWSATIGNESLPSGAENSLFGVLSYLTADFTEFGVKDGDDIIDASKIDDEAIINAIFNNTNTMIGDNVLMINNKVPTAYTYRTSQSTTLNKASYYEISLWVLTYFIDEGKGARIFVSIGQDTFSFNNVNTSVFGGSTPQIGEWTKYTYYIKTTDVRSSTINLAMSLGRYLESDTEGEQLLSGYAFFDNVYINEITKAEFDVENAKFQAARADGATDQEKAFLNTNSVIIIEAPDLSIPSDPTDDPDPTPIPNQFPWLLVSSLLIGAALVAVLVAVFVKKIYPKIEVRRRKKFKKTTYDRITSKQKTPTNKSSRYDKYKD